MPRLSVFNNVTLDGYFTSASGDLNWAYAGGDDAEWTAFVAGNAKGDGQLLFGRITYEMMASYWPTPAARDAMPAVAEGMNRMPKTVVSRTMKEAAWDNTRLMKGDLVDGVRRLKQKPGPDIAILGSGSVVAQLAEPGLIDEYQVVVHPIVLGAGRTMFDGVTHAVPLTLTKTRAFGNGKVVLWYEAAG